MKQPIESDFDIRNHDAGVDVTFKPTESQYSFVLLADRRCLSPRASVRHRKTGVLRSRVLVIRQHPPLRCCLAES
jgi:hypothetical protein